MPIVLLRMKFCRSISRPVFAAPLSFRSLLRDAESRGLVEGDVAAPHLS